MKPLAAIRRHQNGAVHTVLALFATVWLSMALQPCVMAMDIGDPEALSAHRADCPHCFEDTSAAGHCDESAQSHCTYIDGFDYDGRGSSLHQPDFNGTVVGLLPAPIQVRLFPQQVKLPPSAYAPTAPTVRLNIRYCVFLN